MDRAALATADTAVKDFIVTVINAELAVRAPNPAWSTRGAVLKSVYSLNALDRGLTSIIEYIYFHSKPIFVIF